MVTVFDCMPNHGDCTLTHNKLRRLYYIDNINLIFDTTTNLWSDSFLERRGGDFKDDDNGNNAAY